MSNVSDLVKALHAATLSSSGTDITILCSDHDTKDAIFNGLEALAVTSQTFEKVSIPVELVEDACRLITSLAVSIEHLGGSIGKLGTLDRLQEALVDHRMKQNGV